MNEKELGFNVEHACKTFGIRYYHTWNSRHSAPGFPDYVILTSHGVLYRELKADKGKLTWPQVQWINNLEELGQDVAVWRPADWPVRILKELRAAE